MIMKSNVHVVKHEGSRKWEVKVDDSNSPHGAYRTQREAIEKGRELSKRNHSELMIHGRDGKIREKYSYGNDPRDIKG